MIFMSAFLKNSLFRDYSILTVLGTTLYIWESWRALNKKNYLELIKVLLSTYR